MPKPKFQKVINSRPASVQRPAVASPGLMLSHRRGVTSIAKGGSSKLHGAVTLSAGTGLTLTQVGQDIELDITQVADVGALTDNTGQTPDDTIENVAATSSPADAAPTATSAGVGAATLSTTAVATTASVDAAISTLQTRINALPTKASVDAGLAACEKNISDLTDQVNALRTALRSNGIMA